MSTDYTFYDLETGIITFNATCSEEVLSSLLANTSDSYIEGSYSNIDYYIENSLPVLITEKPSKFHFFNYTTKQWELNLQTAEEVVKNIRNQLLQESDWTDTVSAQTRLGETLYNAWQDYRQQLRDIPLQSGYPLEVIYPEPPVS